MLESRDITDKEYLVEKVKKNSIHKKAFLNMRCAISAIKTTLGCLRGRFLVVVVVVVVVV